MAVCVSRVLLAVFLLAPASAFAQWVVTDPAHTQVSGMNLVQSTLAAIRNLQSNVHEVQMINQQIRQLANEAQALAALPLNLANEIAGTITTYTDLLAEGKGIAFKAQRAVQDFEQLYAHPLGGPADILARVQATLGQVRQAGHTLAQVSAIYERLCAQQDRLTQLLQASAASLGPHMAAQAGNQLLGEIAQQQASVQQLLAASNHLQLADSMRMTIAEEAAKARWEHELRGASVPQFQPFNDAGDSYRLPK